MESSNLKIKAETLNELACQACTKNWLKNHDNLTDPIEDINLCFKAGLITSELKERLIKEVLDINSK
tara:strand:+ start:132 stop:332 length:201 start_codon:yes stop_codon:yes gene_type:complete